MPALPDGEQELQDLALQFAGAEGYVLAMLAEAATGDRTWATKWALAKLAALRLLDAEQPVVVAYLAEHPKGHADAVRDLAGALAKRLDQGAKTAADGVRDSFRKVTKDNADELLMSPLTAAIDTSGNRWALGSWTSMNTLTIGRHATSRGLAERLGHGHNVTVRVGQCRLCQAHSGDATIGQDPLPPYHPSCSCVAGAP